MKHNSNWKPNKFPKLLHFDRAKVTTTIPDRDIYVYSRMSTNVLHGFGFYVLISIGQPADVQLVYYRYCGQTHNAIPSHTHAYTSSSVIELRSFCGVIVCMPLIWLFVCEYRQYSISPIEWAISPIVISHSYYRRLSIRCECVVCVWFDSLYRVLINDVNGILVDVRETLFCITIIDYMQQLDGYSWSIVSSRHRL